MYLTFVGYLCTEGINVLNSCYFTALRRWGTSCFLGHMISGKARSSSHRETRAKKKWMYILFDRGLKN